MESMSDAFSKLLEKLELWLNTFVTMLPNVLVALVVLIIAIIISRSVRGIATKSLYRISSNRTANTIIISLSQITIILIGVFVALGILNLDKTVTSLLAGVGIAGLALGFAFKEAASNFISGVYMAFKSPINEGDLVKYEDIYGNVKRIGLRATTIKTLQGQDVVIPNRLIFENTFTHFTGNGERRIDLNVGISYGDDLQKVEEVTLHAIKKLEFLLPGKPVDLYYHEFGSSSINFTVRYWISFTKETDYLHALSEGIKSIKKAYNENDITITFPIRTLDFGIKGGTTLAEMLNQVKNLAKIQNENEPGK